MGVDDVASGILAVVARRGMGYRPTQQTMVQSVSMTWRLTSAWPYRRSLFELFIGTVPPEDIMNQMYDYNAVGRGRYLITT